VSNIIPFDKRIGKIWFNGQYVEWQDAKTHILCHGLNYGSSAFEGIKVYNGKPFKLKEHFERFKISAKTLHMELGFTVEELSEAAQKVIEYNDIKSGYIRPLVWRGAETMIIDGRGCKTNVAVTAWKSFLHNRDEMRDVGMKLCVSSWKKPAADASPYFTKASCIYTLSTIIKNDAMDLGFDDAIVLDAEGYITESSTSNIFFVFGDELHTPIPDCFLNGITRQTVIELAKSNGVKVVERKITTDEIKKADAAFLTGTAVEIMPVNCIDEHGLDVKNNLALKFIELYHDCVNGA
jgi:branched-chain amino acid aminotransferase